MCLMDLPDRPGKKKLAIQYNPSKYFLYQDIMLGYYDDQYKPKYKKAYEEYAALLKQAASESEKYGYIYDLLSKLSGLLTLKIDLGVKLRKAYKAGNKAALRRGVGQIKKALKALDEFHEAVRVQWFTECRPFGYEVLDGRLGWVKARMESAKERVALYLKGEITVIEEFEKDILPFDGCNIEIAWNWWQKTVSTINI